MITALVRNLTALLFPETTATSNSLPSTQSQQFQNTVFLLPYTHSAVSNAIKQNKYHQNMSACTSLAQTLDTYLDRITGDFAVITVPQTYTRWRERGFDHLIEILKCSKHKDLHKRNILYKSRHTRRQAHVSKAKRATQQLQSFTCNQKNTSSLPKTVILFDDVITTGATMEAARVALQPHLDHDTRLICLALAH